MKAEAPFKDPIIVSLGGGIDMTFRHIPAGHFRMGQRGGNTNEEPVTELKVPEFWIGETPVTQEQFRVMAEQSNLSPITGFFAGDHQPVEQVEVPTIMILCAWLKNRLEMQLGAGWTVALPSEEQWEFACFGGVPDSLPLWTCEDELAELAWFANNSLETTQPVARLLPNPFGLFDMLGNVWEYCSSQWEASRFRLLVPGPLHPEITHPGPCHSLRGGAFDRPAEFCTGKFRMGDVRPKGGYGPQGRSIGFRLCISQSAGDGPGRLIEGKSESGLPVQQARQGRGLPSVSVPATDQH